MTNCCNPNRRIQDELDELYDKFNKILGQTLPYVDTSDDGKFLRVVNGVWDKATVPYAEDSKF